MCRQTASDGRAVPCSGTSSQGVLGWLQERIEEAKRELEDAVERECTFVPVIDARSAGMMSHRSIVLKVCIVGVKVALSPSRQSSRT